MQLALDNFNKAIELNIKFTS
ncbi:hypothetical protein CY0110_16087 [Crocosphaera chwakensis CCY0110]|uniref:Uncharacterized protein n=1 Tax=Crocosphaera chwakensis CCY0110 TaxID=391612 RepID=A3IHP9_9CHRO|nr:hypothetical protein CY0110_16087 [Crocosphaera chwakensis CCY0110]